MFDDLIRELKRMEREPVKLPVEADKEGYFDRECPNKDCEFQFKVFIDDWGEGFEGKQMHCPLCGTQAPADHYWTKEQLTQMQQQAVSYFSGKLGQAMSRGARKFNSRQPHGAFISMSLEWKGSTHVPALGSV